jgi:nucleotide-binding universal stress UspA family protein
LRGQSLNIATRVVGHDHPAVAIVEQAGQLGCDLIALSTHGRGGLQRLILRSVADKVLRGTSVPVVVQRGRT